MITRSNYEQFFLDFHEDCLDESMQQELFAFLEQNQDLKEEFENFVQIKLDPEPHIILKDKAALHKRAITEQNYLTHLVAFMEGDLSKELDLEVRNYLQSNPSAQADFEILKRTKIHPEFSNKLIDKTSLYKGGKVLQFNTRLFRISAIAASLVILLLSYTIIIRFQKENSLADIEIERSEKSEINLPLTSEGSKEQQMKLEKKLITSVEDRKDNTPSQRKTHKQENLVVPEVAFAQGEKVVEDQSRALPDIEPVAIESGKNVVLPIETKIETLITLPANEPLAHTDEELEKVFSKEELVALGVLTAEKIDSETSNLWKLADSGVDRLAKATGTNMDIAKADTDSESSTTFALGKFSFTRSRMR